MKLCIDCKYYEAGQIEIDDICLHEMAQFGGVRSYRQFRCVAMRPGICKEHGLFEPKDAGEPACQT